MNKKISVLVFDLDGTLVDSMKGFGRIAARVMEKHHHCPLDKAQELYRQSSGIPFIMQLEQLFPDHPANTLAAREFEEKKLIDFFCDDLTSGCLETLGYLSSKGLALVISSNNYPQPVQRFVKERHLPISLVMAYEGPLFCKGRPHFDHCSRHFGISTSEMLFVGDSLADGLKARASGVDFVGLEGTFSREEFCRELGEVITISRLPDLKHIVFPGSKC